MYSFGRLFRISIFGESHGEYVGVLIEGCPAGLPLSEHDFVSDLERRRGGGKGKTGRVEEDFPLLKTGVFEGKTTGAPILILFENKNIRPYDYEDIRFLPRPGHADFVSYKKYGGFNDFRGGGQFSGRLTLGLVASGVIAKKLIEPISVEAKVVEVCGKKDIEQTITEIEKEGDSCGGIVECKISNVPLGLGEPFFDSCESLLSHIIFSIPGVKGIEFGKGFESARMKGSEYNDELIDLSGKTRTNNAGGIVGGITNGNDVVLRVAVRPTASIKKRQITIDLRTGEIKPIEIGGRHDVCFALRIPPIVEAASAIVFADLMLIEQNLRRVWKR